MNSAKPVAPSLAGRRIVITRARAQAKQLARRLEELGGIVVEFPTIEIAPPADPAPLDDAIRQLESYDWLILTSVNAVDSFLNRCRALGVDPATAGPDQVAAIGPATAKRLAGAGIGDCLVPGRYQAEGILDVIDPANVRNCRVLLPRAVEAREVLPETLRSWGAQVDVVEAYRTIVPDVDGSVLADLLRRKLIDMIMFTSPSTVQNFARLLGDRPLAAVLNGAPIACIGPITRAAVEELGGTASVTAEAFTTDGLVAAIVRYFTRVV